MNRLLPRSRRAWALMLALLCLWPAIASASQGAGAGGGGFILAALRTCVYNRDNWAK